MPDRSRRPRDPNQLGKLIVDIATGEVEDTPEDDGKDPAAVALGRKGGKKAQAESMTPGLSRRSRGCSIRLAVRVLARTAAAEQEHRAEGADGILASIAADTSGVTLIIPPTSLGFVCPVLAGRSSWRTGTSHDLPHS